MFSRNFLQNLIIKMTHVNMTLDLLNSKSIGVISSPKPISYEIWDQPECEIWKLCDK